MLARLLLWRMLGLAAAVAGTVILAGLLGGGLGAALRHSGVRGRDGAAARASRARHRAAGPAPRVATKPSGGSLAACCRARGLDRCRSHLRRPTLPCSRRAGARDGGGATCACGSCAYRADARASRAWSSMYESLHQRLQCAGGGGCCTVSPHSPSRFTARRDARRHRRRMARRRLPARLGGRARGAPCAAPIPNCALEAPARDRSPRAARRAAPAQARALSSSASSCARSVRELAREPPIDRLLSTMAACCRGCLRCSSP